MHIQRLTIPPAATNSRRHNNELVLRDEIPNAALLAGRLVARVGLDVEFQRRDEREQEGEEELEGEEHFGGFSPGERVVVICLKGWCGDGDGECLGHAAVAGSCEGGSEAFRAGGWEELGAGVELHNSSASPHSDTLYSSISWRTAWSCFNVIC